eukprot:scaffold35117_cov129-Isochrysis_galbana.AAC.2
MEPWSALDGRTPLRARLRVIFVLHRLREQLSGRHRSFNRVRGILFFFRGLVVLGCRVGRCGLPFYQRNGRPELIRAGPLSPAPSRAGQASDRFYLIRYRLLFIFNL